MAAEIVDAILDGEALELETVQGDAFFAIHTASGDGAANRGAVVILHGRGFHPDWGNVIQPLRVGLAEHGWDTLSIQLPVLGKEATYYDYVDIFPAALPRIDSALAYARSQTSGRVVLLAHSCGAHMAQHWLHARGPGGVKAIDAYVGIGMGAIDYEQEMVEPFALEMLKVPVLDVLAENDYPNVQRLAPERLRQMQRGGHPANRQVRVPDTEHYFVDRGAALLEVVAGWLNEL